MAVAAASGLGGLGTQSARGSDADATPLKCSVGIMAYNEERNIANAIRAVLGQQLSRAEIVELVVVASGCTDKTTDIVASLARDEPRLRLIVEERRAGKASAINCFIATATAPVLLLVNADNVVGPGTVDALVRRFDDPTVGMVGGHPVPVNDDDHFLGFAVHLLWLVHDQVARGAPKLGEVVAFRNVLPFIPTDTAVDELSIQALVTRLGYRLVYEPAAVVYNRGPATVRDFVRQRRRIFAGHLELARRHGYTASTMSASRVGRAVLASDEVRASWSQPWWTVGAVTLEAGARALGLYDYVRRRPHHVWAAVTTTKDGIAGAGDPVDKHVVVLHVVEEPGDGHAFGPLGSRMLLRRLADDIRGRLGPEAAVSDQMNGTIIVFLPGDREQAERAAASLLRDLSGDGAGVAHRNGRRVQLACAVVSFPRTGHPLAGPVTAVAS